MSLMNPRTCINCIECPKCETMLKIKIGKIDKAGNYYFYSCPFCKWNSIRCDISTKKPNELFNEAQKKMTKELEYRKNDMNNLLNIRQIDFLFKSSYYQSEVPTYKLFIYSL